MKLEWSFVSCCGHLIKCCNFYAFGSVFGSSVSSMSWTSYSAISFTISIAFFIKSSPIFCPTSSLPTDFNVSSPTWLSMSVSPPGIGSPVTSTTGSLFSSAFSAIFSPWSGSEEPPKRGTYLTLWSKSCSPPSKGTCITYSSLFLLMWLFWVNSISLTSFMNSGAWSGSCSPPSSEGFESYFGATKCSSGIYFFSALFSLASWTGSMFSDSFF